MNEHLSKQIKDRKEIIEKLKSNLVESLNIPFSNEEIHPDTSLFGTGIGLDSIDALQMVVVIEKEFKCTIEESNMAILRSINTITDYIIENKPSLN